MLGTTEMNVDAELQDLTWKMKNKAKNLDRLEGACTFWCVPNTAFIPKLKLS